jgi:two-component system sensor kinase FixL
LFGFADSEPVTFGRLLEVVHPGDRERMKELVQHMFEHGGEYESEYRITRAGGTTCWILGHGSVELDEHGKPTFARGVSRDITERKQAEEKFRLAVEASPNGILLVNQVGQIVLVNSQIEELFGYGREELIGHSVEILVPERYASEHPEHRRKFFAAPAARAMGAGRELFGRRKDGNEFPVEIGLNPIKTPNGVLVLAAVVDISARLEAEEEARRRREQVELLSRVSLLGEMTASLAHELNQPLAAIMNNASAAMEYIEQGRLNAKQLQEILTDVMGDGRRAFDIVQNVRNAIKKGTAIRGRINLNDVAKSVAHMLQPDAAANFCKVEMSLAPDLPTIEGDPTQIQQVLINLVSNAFDAMGETPASRRIVEITTTSNGDGTISVAVRDHGRGIAETARERLFEHFFTTKKEGLGMGLAIVRSIVEAHGGTISAENAQAGGARFRFRLPITEEMPQ